MNLRKYEEMNSQQIDALREVGSIGTGNAATALSALLGCEVRIPLPEVQVLEFNDAVEKLGGFETVSAGIISSLSGEINGLMLALVQLDAINLILKQHTDLLFCQCAVRTVRRQDRAIGTPADDRYAGSDHYRTNGGLRQPVGLHYADRGQLSGRGEGASLPAAPCAGCTFAELSSAQVGN